MVTDVSTHAVRSTWPAGCGSEGPRGIAVDAEGRGVIVACTSGVRILDGQHDGALLGTIATGAGVDNVEWFPPRRLLHVGAAKAAQLTVAQIDAGRASSVVAIAATEVRARNPVVDKDGNACLADPMHGGIIVVSATP